MNSRDNNNRNRNDRSGYASNNRRNNTTGRSTRSGTVRGFGDDNETSSHSGIQSNSPLKIATPHAQTQAQAVPVTSFPGLSSRDQADLESFRVALKELTFNSLPIIEKLTGMAKERAKSIAGPVSRTILDNLVFNHPKLKSCFLFLIDSISKNVGDPYPNSFVKHGLVSAYIRVYGEICVAGDEGQRRDFLRVLPTWQGVFPVESLREIEAKLNMPVSSINPVVNPIVNLIPNNPIPANYSNQTVKLLKDLQSVFINPPGPHISGIVSEIFNRLHRSGELTRETLEELDFKAKIADKRQIIEAISLLLEGKPVISRRTTNNRETSKTDVTSKQPEVIDNFQSTINTNESNLPPSPTFNFELPPNFQLDLSLLSSIVELNKLTSTSPPLAVPCDKHFVDIPVSSSDLLQHRQDLFKLLYDDLALHCKTCGIRFRDTPKGQERMTEHLDSHFRRNMRLKEKSKRVMARDWFGSENDWILGKSDSEGSNEKTVNIFEESNESEIIPVEGQSAVTFVEASEEEQSSQVKCSICQEVISVIWNDESEQWIFPSCIRNESNQIVHFNCVKDPEPIKKRQKNN